MHRILGLAAACLTLVASGSQAATPSGTLHIFNESPAAFSFVVNAGPENTVKAGSRFGAKASVGQVRFKVTGRGFARTETLFLDTSNSFDINQGSGSLRWCLSVTATSSTLMPSHVCFKKIMPQYGK
jgi:hypothetical protein